MPKTLAKSTMSDDAGRALLARLRAQGRRLWMKRANCLGIDSWPALSAEDQQLVTANRPLLKRLVAAEGQSAPSSVPTPLGATSPAAVPLCEFCGGPCCGPRHPAYRTLHGRDASEVERRNAEATAVMLRQMPYGLRDSY